MKLVSIGVRNDGAVYLCLSVCESEVNSGYWGQVGTADKTPE